jgi:hypothetical protein
MSRRRPVNRQCLFSGSACFEVSIAWFLSAYHHLLLCVLVGYKAAANMPSHMFCCGEVVVSCCVYCCFVVYHCKTLHQRGAPCSLYLLGTLPSR